MASRIDSDNSSGRSTLELVYLARKKQVDMMYQKTDSCQQIRDMVSYVKSKIKNKKHGRK